MALIKCPECSESVSDSAKSCGNCQYPIYDNLVLCPECQTRVFETESACGNCGYPVPKIISAAKSVVIHEASPSKNSLALAEVKTPESKVQQPQVYARTSQGDSVARSTEIAQGMGAAMAMQKSYVGTSCLLLFVLYPMFYLPGLIMNIVYLNEAKRIKKLAGIAPTGTGFLSFLLTLFFWLPLFGGIAVAVFIGINVMN